MTKLRIAFLLMIAALFLPALPASAQICPSISQTLPLVVNATTTVGSVQVVNDLTNLYVTVTTVAPYAIDQLQLHVSPTLLGIPRTAGGAPQTAQFANQATFQAGVTTFTFTSPLGTFHPGAQYYFAVHALVHQGTTCQKGSGDDGEDDHDHESDDASVAASFLASSSGGGYHSGDHHGEGHNSDDDGHCSDVSSDNSDDHHHSSVSGRSSSSGSHHSSGDNHHSGDDKHHGDRGDDDSSQTHNCSCSKQSAWSGNLLFPGGTTETYFTFALNCGLPE